MIERVADAPAELVVRSTLDLLASALILDPPAPLGPPAGAPVQTWPDASGRVRARAYQRHDGYEVTWPGLARYTFGASGLRVRATPVPGASQDDVRDTYERLILPLAWTVNGGEALHASAVCHSSGVVLLCAPSGTGKSTLACALARSGWPFLADDGVLLDARSRPPVAYPAAQQMRLRQPSARFYALAEVEQPGRAAVSEATTIADGLPGPVAAVFDLQRTEERTVLPRAVRLDAGEALASVLAHAHCVNPTSAVRRRRSVEQVLAMLTDVPVWRLTFPTDFDLLKATVDVVEQTVGTG